MRMHLSKIMLFILPLLTSSAYGDKEQNQPSATITTVPSLSDEIAMSADTEMPHPRPTYNGLRIADGLSGDIYLVMGGILRQIPNGETYNNLFIDWNGIKTLDFLEDSFIIGSPLDDGAVLIGRSTGELYLVTDNKKYHISSAAAMTRYYFNYAKVEFPGNPVVDGISPGFDL